MKKQKVIEIDVRCNKKVIQKSLERNERFHNFDKTTIVE